MKILARSNGSIHRRVRGPNQVLYSSRTCLQSIFLRCFLPQRLRPPRPRLRRLRHAAAAASHRHFFRCEVCNNQSLMLNAFFLLVVGCWGMQDLEAKIRPTHGTSYGQGLSSAWDVASGGVEDAGEQFVLIFLSDGRVSEWLFLGVLIFRALR